LVQDFGFSAEGVESAPDNTFSFHPLIMKDLVQKKPKYKFQHLKYIGSSKSCCNAVPASDEQREDPIFQSICEKEPKFLKIKEIAQHMAAKCDPGTYEKSLRKCDVPKIKPCNAMYDLAVQYTQQMYSYLAGSGMAEKVDYNTESAVGIPFNRMINPDTGIFFKTKGELLKSSIASNLMNANDKEIFGVAAKAEFLPKSDVLNGKARTYFSGPTTLCMKQKILYDNMDQGMVDQAENYFRSWSRYGFVRQYGGFDRLAKAHLKMEERAKRLGIPLTHVKHKTSDVSGYDRSMPVLDDVYMIRKNLFGKMNERQETMHENVVHNVVTPYVATFNGDIYQRDTGNCSGSGKTTSDNTIGHTIIEFYAWIKMFYEKNERLPTFMEIIDMVIESLYGDDDLGSFIVSEWMNGSTVEEMVEKFKQKYIECYQEFGLLIKESAFKVQSDINGLEFLGGEIQFSPKYNAHLAVPRVSKIATTLSSILEGDRDLVQYSSILQAVYALTWAIDDPSCNLFQEYLVYFARFLLDENNLQCVLSHADIMFLSGVVLGSKSGENLVLGLEGKPSGTKDISLDGTFFGVTTNFFLVPQSKREKVGFKSEMNYIKFDSLKNYKGMLLEACAKHKVGVPQVVFTKSGPDHNPTFTAKAIVQGRSYIAQGSNKNNAERMISYKILYEDYELEDLTLDILKVSVSSYPQFTSVVVRQEVPKQAEKQQELREPHHQQLNETDEEYQARAFKAAYSSYMGCLMKGKYDGHPYLLYAKGAPQCDIVWLTLLFKEGSFNPYGNGQTTQFTITQPTIMHANGLAICSSTCLVPRPTNIIGTGTDDDEAFDSWLEQVVGFLGFWRPLHTIPLLEKMRTLSPPPAEHPLSYIWTDTNCNPRFKKEFLEGSFNPYGNGQTSRLNKQNYLKSNPTLAQKSKEEQDTMYANYLKRHTKQANKIARTPKDFQSMKSQIGNTNQKKYKNNSVSMGRVQQSQKEIRQVFQARGDSIKLSPCAKNYAAALACPFAHLDESCLAKVRGFIDMDNPPCIPTFPAIKTRKCNAFARGTMGVQADGSAMITLSPRRLANNYASGNTDPPILYSTTGTTFIPGIPVIDTAAGWLGGFGNLNTEFNQAELIVTAQGEGIQYRVVAAGLRTRYVGKMVDQSGICHSAVDPNHYSMTGLTIQQLGQMDSYFNAPLETDRWITLNYVPETMEEFLFQPDSISNPGFDVGRNTQYHYMSQAFTGLPPGENIAWEVIVWYEIYGKLVRGKTDTPVDPSGVGVVLNSIKTDNQKGNQSDTNIVNTLKAGSGETTVTNAGAGLMKMATDILPKLIM
jgi:hypothetical protein